MPHDSSAPSTAPIARGKRSAATQFFLRGLAISLPPILTLLILIWIGRVMYDYIVYPISRTVQFTIAQFIDDSVPTDSLVTWTRLPPLDYVGRDYRVTPQLKQELQRWIEDNPDAANRLVGGDVPGSRVSVDGVYVPLGARAVPYLDYVSVARWTPPQDIPATAIGLYMEIVTTRYFSSLFNLSGVAVAMVIVALYFLGRVVTARLGGWFVSRVETLFLGRLPFVRTVYSSVKQVTDFVFSDRSIEYSRVVAIEYPQPGLWALGFVTGEGLLDVEAATGEPCVNVLIPSSPWSMSGYTIMVPRSRVLDLNLTMDQAFQFLISCGVLVPRHQRVGEEAVPFSDRPDVLPARRAMPDR